MNKIKSVYILFYFTIIICVLFFSWSFVKESFYPKYPKEVESALKLAGENRIELEKVLKHYQLKTEDSLKLKAAKYLIANMPGHYGVSQQLQNNMGKGVKFDFSSYKSGESKRLSQDLDSLGYRFVTTEVNYDLHVVSSDFLIENIELAFEVWQYPWCKHLSFEQFCEYILPYRCQSEELCNYRKYYKEKYSWLVDSLKNKEDTREAANFIKLLLEEEIKYSAKYKGFYKGFLSPFNMEKARVGTCEHLANHCLLVMRSCGIPATYDEILYWSKWNNGHVVNTIHANNGIEYECVISSDSIANKRELTTKPTKVRRHTWKLHEKGIWDYKMTEENVPAFFMNRHVMDVTDKFSYTSDLVIDNIEKELANMIYLCTFNNGKWNPIDWSIKNQKGSFVYKNITDSLLYSIMKINKHGIELIDHPFIFYGSNHKRRILVPDYDRLIDLEIDVNVNVCHPSSHGTDTIFYINYWDNGWIQKKVDDYFKFRNDRITKKGNVIKREFYKLKVNDIPSNTLYWPGYKSRLYVYDDEAIVSF